MSSSTPKSQNPTMAPSIPEAQESRTCANCHKPANQACSGCKDAPIIHKTDTAQKAYYCSTNCQKSHWSTHKPHCKTFQTRKYLYRAGSLLQDIFLVYREKMFDKLISRIEERDGKLLVHDGVYGSRIKQVFFPFPGKKVIAKKEDKMAVLCHSACTEIAWMDDLVWYLLSDIATMKEVTLIFANPPRLTINPGGLKLKGPNDKVMLEPHNITTVTLKHSKETYALDLSGSQYGYYEPVVPWNIFLPRVEKFSTNNPEQKVFKDFGYQKRMQLDIISGADNEMNGFLNLFSAFGADFNDVAGANAKIHPGLIAGAKAWDSTRDKPSIKDMLKGTEKAFEENRGELVKFIGGFGDDGLEKWKKGLEVRF